MTVSQRCSKETILYCIVRIENSLMQSNMFFALFLILEEPESKVKSPEACLSCLSQFFLYVDIVVLFPNVNLASQYVTKSSLSKVKWMIIHHWKIGINGRFEFYLVRLYPSSV